MTGGVPTMADWMVVVPCFLSTSHRGIQTRCFFTHSQTLTRKMGWSGLVPTVLRASSTGNGGTLRKAFLVLLFTACGYGPSGPPLPDLEAGYRVEEADSLRTVVFFHATAPGPFWWRLDWVDIGYLWDYGQAMNEVEVPVIHGKTFEFWMDFTVWNQTDTVVVTYMSPGG